MDAAETLTPVPTDRARASSVRSQAALLHALLDEVERVLPSNPGDAASAELAQELERLGRRCIEAANVLVQASPKREEVPPCV